MPGPRDPSFHDSAMNPTASITVVDETPIRRSRHTPWAMAIPVRTPEGSTVRPTPLLLAEGAQRALHAHAVRDAARAAVLLATDVATLMAIRIGARALFEVPAVALLTTSVAARIPLESSSTTMEHLNWLLSASDAKAVIAIILGLAFAGAYRPGDHRRSATLMIAGVFIGVLLNGWENLWHVPQAIPVTLAGAAAAGLVLAGARL